MYWIEKKVIKMKKKIRSEMKMRREIF